MFIAKANQSKFYRQASVVLFVSILLICLVIPAKTQEPNLPEPKSEKALAADPISVPVPIALSNIVNRADSDYKRLGAIRAEVSKNPALLKIGQELPELSKSLDTRVSQTQEILLARPSLETLRSLEEEWQSFASVIVGWKGEIKTQSDEFNNKLDDLKVLIDLWQRTLGNITRIKSKDSIDKIASEGQDEDSIGVEIPNEVFQKTQFTIDEINKTKKFVEKKRAELLTLEVLVSEQSERIDTQQKSIVQAHALALKNLFVSDQPPIWRIGETSGSSVAVLEETQSSLAVQASALAYYAEQRTLSFLLHGVFFLFLLAVMLWIRHRITSKTHQDLKLKRATQILRFPVMTALLFSLLVSDLFYPQAPRMLSSLLQAAALLPGIVILRRLIPKQMFPLLYALAGFYFTSRIVEMCASLQFVTRVLFLLNMLGAILFSVWFFYSIRCSNDSKLVKLGIYKVSKFTLPPAIVAFVAAFLANSLGFVGLSRSIGNGILDSAIIALIFYAGFNVAEGLVQFAVRVRPLSLLTMFKSHRTMIRRRILRALGLFGVISWIIVTLNILSLRDRAWMLITDVLSKEFVTYAFSISLGDILAFGLTVWLAFFLSRILRFTLENDVYHRIQVSSGVSYAISTMLHYILLLVGFVTAVAALGVDIGKFTILAGAFGVGLGFGLQTIVNNFVSGLILLFERPIKVGDVLDVGSEQGVLTQIGLRASTIRARGGADLILPNSQLISEKVTNWTHGDHCRRIEINVGVSYESDPKQIIELLTKVASENPNILSEPRPKTLFMGFGEHSLNFQVRAWTTIAELWKEVFSELAVDVHAALIAAGIKIPFPQLDLHIKDTSKNVAEEQDSPGKT